MATVKDDIIRKLNHEIFELREEVVELKTALKKQKDDMEKKFDEQKQYFTTGVQEIVMLFENEKYNNDRFVIEIEGLRQKNHDLILENHTLKSMLHKYEPDDENKKVKFASSYNDPDKDVDVELQCFC